jgi:hypothetical protein
MLNQVPSAKSILHGGFTNLEFVYKNSIYFALLVHLQEYRYELKVRKRNHFCTDDDVLVAQNILSFYIQVLSRVQK